jgi:hypothetical protein
MLENKIQQYPEVKREIKVGKNYSYYSLSEIKEMGKIIAQSGLFGVKSPEQAIALMLIAQAEGKHPAMAAQEYNIINGRPALKADAMLARFQQAGGKVQWKKYTDKVVSAVFSHPSGGEVEVEWTLERAEKAGLTGKDNWKKYPRQMLKARVISEGVRLTYPIITVGIYTPEEIMDFDNTENTNTSIQEEVKDAEVVENNVIDINKDTEVEKLKKTLAPLGMELETKEDFAKVTETIKGAIYQNRQLLKELGFKFHGGKKIWYKKIA